MTPNSVSWATKFPHAAYCSQNKTPQIYLTRFCRLKVQRGSHCTPRGLHFLLEVLRESVSTPFLGLFRMPTSPGSGPPSPSQAATEDRVLSHHSALPACCPPPLKAPVINHTGLTGQFRNPLSVQFFIFQIFFLASPYLRHVGSQFVLFKYNLKFHLPP